MCQGWLLHGLSRQTNVPAGVLLFSPVEMKILTFFPLTQTHINWGSCCFPFCDKNLGSLLQRLKKSRPGGEGWQGGREEGIT